MTDLEFTEACEQTLALAQQHLCRYWLLDNRADESIRVAGLNDWVTEEYLPRARKVLGRAPCIAFLAHAAFWQTLQALGPLPLVGPSVAFQAGAFTQEADARAWLQSLRPAMWPQLALVGHPY